MVVNETKVRVYYEDTDKMGVVYYGVYPRYYEIGRTELIREIGISYKEIEDSGVILPARSLKVNDIKSAYYDELLTVRTIVDEIPKVKFPIKTEIYNSKGELINHGEVILAFFDEKKQKPCRIPKNFEEALKNALRKIYNPTILNSVLRLLPLPSTVSFESTGDVRPYPLELRRLSSIPY